MSDFEASLARFQRWFIEDALPFWAAHGYDRGRGGFYEALNFDGTPSNNRPRRTRAQTRQIHTFSQAGLRGWHADAEALAAKGFEHFLETACPDNGARGCVHLIDDNGAVTDDKRDLYDQAFLLLACASRWEAAKDQRALALAERTIEFMNRELASPHGGWLESDQKERPRRQNPHMHLFEAFMTLYRATDDERYLAYIDGLYALFSSAFYDTNEGVVREFFTDDWRLIDSDEIEPGHMLEWIWLLHQHQRIRRSDMLDVSRKLYARALEFGADPSFHGFVDNTARLGGGGAHGAKRLWPQTEYIRAAIVMRRCGLRKAEDNAARIIDRLFETYLKTEFAGLWIDEFDADGAPVARDVPASILYHLFEAVAETERVKEYERAS